MKKLLYIFFVLMGTCSMTSCSSDDNTDQEASQKVSKYKVAVIMEDKEAANWQRTAEWFLENIRTAQVGMPSKVDLELTFKSQDDADIEQYMNDVANDDEVKAIIGPTTSDKAERLAEILRGTAKPMITPCATDAEYQRKYSSADNVWNMSESEIAQLEILLSNVSLNEEKKVYLLAHKSDDRVDAQDTYVEWFAFIAEEFGIKEHEVLLYKNESDIRKYAQELCGNNHQLSYSVLIFNPATDADALAFDDEVAEIGREIKESKNGYLYHPRILCSDAFYAKGIASTTKMDMYEGIDISADPSSGFITAYQLRFGEQMMNGEAQFYDAMLMLTYAFLHQEVTGGTDLNDAIREVVDGRESNLCGWLPADTKASFQKLRQGGLPNLKGVSGEWNFDEKTHVCQQGTSFRHWKLREGNYYTLGYYTTDGSKRSSSSKEMWNWTSTTYQQFGDFPNTINYPELHDRWALIVAGSQGWSNYRFQADALAMYHVLKNHGYDDSHIVLIMEDDIAHNPKNKYPAEIKTKPDGLNLYVPNAIDYKLNSLLVSDLGRILRGEKTDRLQKVLHPTENDNVFVFWSSHGSKGALDFGSTSAAYWEMLDVLKYVPHRKMMVAVEACFSGGLGKYCEGMEGIIFLTAANPNETSHAAEWDETLGIFRSNGFTKGFQEAISQNPKVSLRDLYYTISRNTDGSHVKIYNEAYYGSVFDNTMAEYFD